MSSSRSQCQRRTGRSSSGLFGASSSEVRLVERARIVLAAAEGLKGLEIADRVGCSEPTVVKWRGRYA